MKKLLPKMKEGQRPSFKKWVYTYCPYNVSELARILGTSREWLYQVIREETAKNVSPNFVKKIYVLSNGHVDGNTFYGINVDKDDE